MKNKLEDQLKDAFSNFEPEVDPTLWAKISSQIPAVTPPVQPVPEPTGFLSSLGSAGSWIAGTAAVLVSGAGIYFALNQEPSAVVNLPAAQKQEEVVTPTEIQTEESIPSTESSDKNSAQEELEPANQAETPASFHQSSDKSQVEEVPENNSPVASSIGKTDAPHIDAAPVSAPKPEISERSGNPNSALESSMEKPVPLKLMVNNAGGFAPLSVTVISNQPGKKTEFDFGDGATAREESSTHIYRDAGIYILRCQSGVESSEREIEVLEAIPTAFSPNGDGANDSYTINNSNLREIELRIHHRNGRQVFSGKGNSVSWNGHYADGRPAETGTYFYDIFVTSSRGNVYKQKGTLTLFR